MRNCSDGDDGGDEIRKTTGDNKKLLTPGQFRGEQFQGR